MTKEKYTQCVSFFVVFSKLVCDVGLSACCHYCCGFCLLSFVLLSASSLSSAVYNLLLLFSFHPLLPLPPPSPPPGFLFFIFYFYAPYINFHSFIHSSSSSSFSSFLLLRFFFFSSSSSSSSPSSSSKLPPRTSTFTLLVLSYSVKNDIQVLSLSVPSRANQEFMTVTELTDRTTEREQTTFNCFCVNPDLSSARTSVFLFLGPKLRQLLAITMMIIERRTPCTRIIRRGPENSPLPARRPVMQQPPCDYRLVSTCSTCPRQLLIVITR